LHPNDPATYQALALTQLHSGQLKAAQQTCELALRKNFDGTKIRHLLLLALYAQNDITGVATQLEWGRNHPDSLQLHVDAISLALSKGEVQRAQALLAELRARQYPPALAAEYQSGLASIARALAELDLTSESLELLKSLPAAVTQDRNALVALAENGDGAESDQALQQLVQEHGQETLWKAVRIPEVRSAVSLAKHEPQQAVSVLEPALPFDGLTFGPAYLRGKAYLALGKAELAQSEFRKITEHIYVDPLSAEYPLALLASARTYVQQNQSDKAREQLERFLDLWKSADADLPLLQAARAEYDSSPVDVSLRPD
jgi:tetratricopeptide (TPR) repeat protein